MTSMVIQENLPEGVNLPLEPFTVLYLIENKGTCKTTFSATWQSHARHIF